MKISGSKAIVALRVENYILYCLIETGIFYVMFLSSTATITYCFLFIALVYYFRFVTPITARASVCSRVYLFILYVL